MKVMTRWWMGADVSDTATNTKQKEMELSCSTEVLHLVLLLAALTTMQPAYARDRPPLSETGPDANVEQFDMPNLEANLRGMPAGPEHDYFAGVLANAENHITDSIHLLTNALPTLQTSRPDRAVVALCTLADDYRKLFRYGNAASVYQDLLSHFPNQITCNVQDQLAAAKILSHAPPQTITWDGPVKITTERNPMGGQNVELTVNGVKGPWVLDTGANVSAVSEKFAQRLRLDLLPGVTQTSSGVTGIENPVRAALLPTLQIGGATLHNVVVMVLPDANLNLKLTLQEEKQRNLGNSTYQIDGIIGYPVFQALGTITFYHDDKFEAGRTQSSTAGARMYMSELTPIVECTVEGKDLPFAFDTGAVDTTLLVRYFRELRSKSTSWRKRKEKLSGVGGVVKRKVYVQPELKLVVGNRTVILKNVSIYPPSTAASTGTDYDEFYGYLGQDVAANFERVTFDFKNMSFTLDEPIPSNRPPMHAGSEQNPPEKQ
jgi:hypothetical protein